MRVAIVGAGISGLAAAHELKKAGAEPVLLERGDRVGGRIRTERRGEWVFDVGAFIYLGSYADATEAMHELGLAPQKFDAYGAMPRDGKLNFLDFNKPLRTGLGTKYISTGSKLKLAKMMFLLARKWKGLNYHDASAVAAIDTESVEEYCRRALNDEILEFVATPVVRGPWLSDPSYASVGQLLWTLKNFFTPYFYGLDEGMDALPNAYARGQEVRLGVTVENVTDHGGRVEVAFADGGSEDFDAAIITATADQAVPMFPQMDPVQRKYYEATDYIASVNTHIALSERPENPATYIMVPRTENEHLSGCIVDHLKARGRAPEGKGMITVFMDHEWCLEHLEAPDDVILDQVLEFLEPYYGDLRPTLADHEIGRWRRVVPIMSTGRFKAVDTFLRSVDPTARVQFAGDLCAAIPGVNASLVSGKASAERVAAQISSRTSAHVAR